MEIISLTHPALRAGSPLSRSAGEGAERSEAGEGATVVIFVPGSASALRDAGCPRRLWCQLRWASAFGSL
jgi:hypothetical protein